MSNEERDEFLNELLDKHADKEMLEKYGDPRDKNDPRNWMPSMRAEKGLSLEEQVRLLSLDVEMLTMSLGNLTKWKLEMQREQMLREFSENPAAALEKLMGIAVPKGSYGPLDNDKDTPIRYAGSVDDTIAPDTIVETPQGPIRADQIPGYSPLPGWKPSPDWAEANCMCPAHQAARSNDGTSPDDDFPTGFYL